MEGGMEDGMHAWMDGQIRGITVGRNGWNHPSGRRRVEYAFTDEAKL